MVLRPYKRKELFNCNFWGNNCDYFWIEIPEHVGRYMPDWDKNKYERVVVQVVETGNGNGPSKFKFTFGTKVTIVDPTTNLKLELSTFSYGFEFDLTKGDCAQDISLGTKSIWYCDKADKPGRLYGTGSVDFRAGHDFPN